MVTITKSVEAIARRVVTQYQGGRCEVTREAAMPAFEEIEALGESAFSAVNPILRLGPNGPVGTLLVAVGERAFGYLDHAITTGEPDEQAGAIKILGAIGEPARENLGSILWESEDEDLRRRAAHELGERVPGGLEILATALKDGSDEVRQSVARVLSGIVTAPERRNELGSCEPVIELLTQILEDPDTLVRYQAFQALKLLDRLSIENVEAALNDQVTEMRSMGLEALFNMGVTTEHAARLVAMVIEDERREIAEQAVHSITNTSHIIDYELLTDVIISELVLRDSGRPNEYFNSSDVAEAIKRAIHRSPRVLGQALQQLCDIAYEYSDSRRRRSALVAAKTNQDEFIAMVNERARKDPVTANAILGMLGMGADTGEIIAQISEAAPGDVQKIAAAEIKLLEKYYGDALGQAKTSFLGAVIAMAVGLLCLIGSLVYLLTTQTKDLVDVLPTLASVMSQFIAYQQFRLYKQTREQLTGFHQQLDQTQRFLLANSVCEALEGEMRQQTRAKLVMWIATLRTESDELSVLVSRPENQDAG